VNVERIMQKEHGTWFKFESAFIGRTQLEQSQKSSMEEHSGTRAVEYQGDKAEVHTEKRESLGLGSIL
jgi:hypothetical protein